MDSWLRKATPVVFVMLALIVWFEVPLMQADIGLLRFVVGLLCLYTMFLVVERQRMEVRFTKVLASFKAFYEQRRSAAGEVGGRDDGRDDEREKGLEAVQLLIEGLRSPDAEARDLAYSHLKRLTEKDFGLDPEPWRAWLRAARAEFEAGRGGGQP